MSLQGFISDKSLIDTAQPLINLEKLLLPCGYLDRDTIEYFVEPLEIVDLRPERLLITYRPEVITDAPLQAILDDLITNILILGEQHLSVEPTETVTLAQYEELNLLDFLGDILPSGPVRIQSTRELKFTLDDVKLSTEDKEALKRISVQEQQHLFNILEYLAYGTISSDTLADINTVFISNPEYLGYVASSIKLNVKRSIVYLYGGINIHRYIPRSVEFKYIVGTTQITVKAWIEKQEFKTQYPESTIINVIPPLELSLLLNPTSLSDPIDSAIASKGVSDNLLRIEITNRDQSGLYPFETRYLFGGKTYPVTFSLIYRGRQPDALEARLYIASYLLNSGIGTRALWEILLPDIFYHSAFAIIPFYDNITELTNADIYPSIINMNTYHDKMNSILDMIPRANDPYREMMTAAYDKYFMGVAPADVNEESSLLALHPTYRDFSTTDIGWNEMSSNDREWAIRLNQALSVAAGETNLLTVSTVMMGGLAWKNFVFNYASYFILTKESYLDHFAE